MGRYKARERALRALVEFSPVEPFAGFEYLNPNPRVFERAGRATGWFKDALQAVRSGNIEAFYRTANAIADASIDDTYPPPREPVAVRVYLVEQYRLALAEAREAGTLSTDEFNRENARPLAQGAHVELQGESLHSLLARDIPEPRFLWGAVPEQGITALTGAPGSLKTFFALSLGLAVAAGNEFYLGEQVTRPGSPVWFVDEESGERRLKQRITDICKGLSIDNPGALPVELFVLSRFSLMQHAQVDALCKKAEREHPAMIVFDSFSKIIPGANENDAGEVTGAMLALRDISEAGSCSVQVIHHTNKSGGNYRGSTAFAADVDLMFQLQRVTDTGRELVEFKTPKARDSEPGTFYLEPRFEHGTFYLLPAVPGVDERLRGSLIELSQLQAPFSPADFYQVEGVQELFGSSATARNYFNRNLKPKGFLQESTQPGKYTLSKKARGLLHSITE